jgi:hypothetical protein
MTSIRLQSLTSYKNELLNSDEGVYVVNIKKYGTSSFYQIVKILSSLVTVGFLSLLVLSISSSVTIHWSIGLIGLLGSIGLTGAIWFSKKLFS